MFQIHPQRAFLNTDIVISNKCEEHIVVRDSLSGDSYSLNIGENISERFKAGNHVFTAISDSGSRQEILVTVEDALKFGGSQRKNCYIFDNNPWAIIVMKDRTYFFNEKTGEQFVEHNLSPDGIEEINEHYLLFETKKDISLYNLEEMSIEKSFSGAEIVYKGKKHCVFFDYGVLIIYRLDKKYKGEREILIECNDYILQAINSEGKGIIRYYNRHHPRLIQTIQLSDNAIEGEHEKEEVMELEEEEEFLCFVGDHSALVTTRNENGGIKSLFVIYPYSGLRKEIAIATKAITSVNGKMIWENKDFTRLSRTEEPGKAIDSRLSVLEVRGKVAYILTSTILEKVFKVVKTADGLTRKIIQTTRLTNSELFDADGVRFTDSNDELRFHREGTFDYVYNVRDNSLYYFPDYSNKQSLTKCKGYICFSECGVPFVGREEEKKYKYYTLEGEYISEEKPSYMGLIKRGYERFFWLKTRKYYICKEVQKCAIEPKPAIVSGGTIGPRFHTPNGDVFAIPDSYKNIIALSQSCRSALIENGASFTIARYNKENKQWCYHEDLVLTIYDSLEVRDAVFCSDGQSFVYQKEDALVLYDFNSGEESIFPTKSGIQYNANGYRPYLTKDFFSRPVIVDPISLRTIDNLFLEKYRFASVDGKAFCEGLVTKYYDRETDEEITHEQYRSLKKEFDSSIGDTAIVSKQKRERRESYWKNTLGKKTELNQLYYSLDPERSFVDQYMVDSNDYVVVNRDGIKSEINVGNVHFLNYVSFSFDNSKVAISLKYKDSRGMCIVYDLDEQEEVYSSIEEETQMYTNQIMAVWLGIFNENGDLAYYDSKPNTYILYEGSSRAVKIKGKSFLTFSPSGKYIALSKQGYICYDQREIEGMWGHVPSCDIFIASTDDPREELCHFNDHGDSIRGVAALHDTVASASFSSDDKRILSVSKDGVVVVRNLHLETDPQASTTLVSKYGIIE